jgi:hypothetical protein
MSLITISGRHVLKQSCDIYIKSNRLCNVCLFAHDCLFDRKSIQSVVWLSVALSATIRFCDLIDGVGPKFSRRSPLIPPRKFATKILEGAGVALAQQYRAQGLNMLNEHAQFQDGSVSVEAGLMAMLERG